MPSWIGSSAGGLCEYRRRAQTPAQVVAAEVDRVAPQQVPRTNGDHEEAIDHARPRERDSASTRPRRSRFDDQQLQEVLYQLDPGVKPASATKDGNP